MVTAKYYRNVLLCCSLLVIMIMMLLLLIFSFSTCTTCGIFIFCAFVHIHLSSIRILSYNLLLLLVSRAKHFPSEGKKIESNKWNGSELKKRIIWETSKRANKKYLHRGRNKADFEIHDVVIIMGKIIKQNISQWGCFHTRKNLLISCSTLSHFYYISLPSIFQSVV